MKKVRFGLICLAILLSVSLVHSGPLPPDVSAAFGTPSREAFNSNLIVFGKVASVEKELVETSLFPPKGKVIQKTPLRIATVKISETLYGRKGLTEIKIGFPAAGGGRPRYSADLFVSEIKEGVEGCFLLVPHHEGDFYIYAGQFTPGPIATKSPAPVAERELSHVRTIAKVMKDPETALKSKDLSERVYALNFLTKTTPTPDGKEVERSKEETGVLLDILTELPYRSNEKIIIGKNDIFYRVLGENIAKLKFQLPLVKPGETSDQSANNAMNDFLKKNRDQIVLKKRVAK